MKKLTGLIPLAITLFGVVHGDIQMLLDTSETTSDLVKPDGSGWVIPPSSQWMDVTGMNLEQETARVLTVCKKPNPVGNFVMSPFINGNGATSVDIEINYVIRECSTLRNFDQCSEEIEIYSMEANSFGQRVDPTDQLSWKKIGSIKPNRSPVKNLTIETISTKGLFIAFKDYGSCTQINSVKIYSHYCPSKIDHLAVFDESPANNVQSEGKCVQNAQQDSYFSAPRMRCERSGWQKASSDISCVCNPGHQPNTKKTQCIPCTPGTYKVSGGLERCSTCPTNSYSTVQGQSQCPCEAGFYRERPGMIDTPCKGVPEQPNNLEVIPSESQAELIWQKPFAYHDIDLYYRVECFECDGKYNDCNPCNGNVQFNKSPDEISEDGRGSNQLKVSKLDSESFYKFKVYSLNAISHEAELDGQFAKYGEIRIEPRINERSQGGPEVVGSVRVEFNDETGVARVTWGAVETDSYEMQILGPEYDSKPRHIMIEKNEYNLDDLSPESTYRIAVRARLDGKYGDWSIEEVFQTGPMNNPTVEAVEGIDVDDTSMIAYVVFAVVIFMAIFALVLFLFVRRVKANKWSKQSQSTYGKTSDGTMDAHFDLIPHIVRPGPTQIDGMSIHSEPETLPQHSDMVKGWYHERPVLLQYGYLSDDQFQVVSNLDHENILKCIGFAPSRQQLVFEYAEHTLPALIGYHRFDIVTITKMIRDIAFGVRFLHSHSYVHRNLTSYNILMAPQSTCPKIAKYLNSDSHVDLRRSAPEVWERQNVSSASDVWSFGIIMWEVFSAYSREHAEPFRGFSESEVIEQIRAGRNLPRPAECPAAAYKLMEWCWQFHPQQRPSFVQICLEMENIISQMDPNGSVAV